MVEPELQVTDSCLTLDSRSTTVKCWRSAERSLRERFLVMPACSSGASSSWMAARSVCLAALMPCACFSAELRLHYMHALISVHSDLQIRRNYQQSLC